MNNTDLKRVDVEKSAYAELLRRANLTGSQALANVVIEEMRRENMNLFGFYKHKQYVSAHASVIEFLDATGNPLPSVSIYASPETKATEPVEKDASSQALEPAQNQEPVMKLTSAEEAYQAVLSDLQKQRSDVENQQSSWKMFSSSFFNSYIEVFNYLAKDPTAINIDKLQKIQAFMNKASKREISFSKAEKAIASESSTIGKVRTFLEYAK